MIRSTAAILIAMVIALPLTASVFAQGVTTSAMRGVVKDANGEVLPGANVIAVHDPSGSEYGTSAGINGQFNIPNMRVGGPYTVRVSFIGFETSTAEGIMLTLGDTYRLNVTLRDSAVELGTVEVIASRGVFDAERTGVGTNIDESRIGSMPTIGRDLADFVRMTPAAFVGNDDDDGPSISIAGQNNRYNSIYIDGAVNNDVFGLSAQGTNGGQTGSTPIAIDAIEEFQINLSPYDVTQSGFTGGAINAVTRSGTNRFEGSAYYYLRNESFVGKTPPALVSSGDSRDKVADFSNQRFGARIGGPIIKNKLFFFANVELLRSETPQPFDQEYGGDTNTAGLESLRQSLISGVGYDPGDFGSKKSTLDDDKILAKLDWNASSKHKVSFRYSYSNAENVDAFLSDARDVNFSNNAEVFPNKTHSVAAELNSTIGADFANKLIFGFTSVDDDRGFAGDPFPSVNINDGSGEIHLGSEPFSTGNVLTQDIFTITNNFNWFKDRHTLTFGTHFEYYDISNLFIGQNFGVYDYDSVADFLASLAGTPAEPDFFTRGYSLVDDKTGDASAAVAAFKAMQIGFYVQDEFQFNDRLRLTGGLRVDIPKVIDDPIFAPDAGTTIADVSAKADLKGAEPGAVPAAALYISPRIGFNYDVMGDRTLQLRGGLGVFTGRVPFVWPGGMFVNNGATVGRASGTTLPNGDPVPFVANPDQGLTGSDFGQTDIPSGRLEMFEDSYRYPRVFRASLGADHDLGNGLVGTLEGQFTKNIDNITIRNVNLNPDAVENMDGPDNRPFYTGSDVFIDPRYEAIHVVGNTGKGYSYDVTAQLSGAYDDVVSEGDRVSFNASYTFGDSRAVNDGTSSQLNSIWRTVEIGGRLPNNPGVSRSDFAIGSRILAGVTFRKAFLQNLATTVSLFYQGESGALFNYTIDRAPIGGGFRDYALVYVPDRASDLTFIPVTLGGVTYSPEQQAAALDRFIDSSSELSDRRGDYADRNGSRMPFEHVLDMRLAQEVFGNIGGRRQKLEVTLDIFNLTNLINKDWGRRYNGFTSSSNGGAEILEFNGFVDESKGDYTPLYQLEFDPARTPTEDDFFDTRTKDFGTYGSRWQMQLGVRYTF